MGKKAKNNKESRRKWWNSLSQDKQNEIINRFKQSKKQKRLKRSYELMKRLGFQYDCKMCIHHLTKSCTDSLPTGCEYFYDMVNDEKGIAYHSEPPLPFNQQKHLNDILR